MGKRTKLILGIIIGAAIILSGTVFGLAKTGKINLKMLADVITQNAGSNNYLKLGIFHQTGTTGSEVDYTPIGAGKTVKIVNNQNSSISYQKVTDSSSLVDFSAIASGFYSVEIIGCAKAVENVPSQTTPYASGQWINMHFAANCGVTPPATGTCGGRTCSANQHCNALAYCIDNCTSTSCPASQTCNSTTKECQNTTPASSTYRFIGNAKEGSNLLSDVNINIVDRSTGSDVKVTPEFKSSSSAGYDGKNYQSAVFARNWSANAQALANIYIQFSKDGYQPQEFKILDDRVITATALIGSGNDIVIRQTIKDVILNRIPTQSQPLDILGMVTQEGNPNPLPGIKVQAGCPRSPNSEYIICKNAASIEAKSTYTAGPPPVKTHGNNQNYSITFDYNIAKAGSQVSTLEFWLLDLSGYYYDVNNNGKVDDDEVGPNQKITIQQKDVLSPEVPTVNSYTVINLALKARPVAANINGKVYDASTRKPIAGAVIGIAKNDGSNSYLQIPLTQTNANGEYSIVTVIPGTQLNALLRAFHKDYSDDAKAQIQIRLDNFGNYNSPQTDFYLNKCN